MTFTIYQKDNPIGYYILKRFIADSIEGQERAEKIKAMSKGPESALAALGRCMERERGNRHERPL